MAAGDITVYREATGTETFTSTTPAAWPFDTRVNEDPSITLDTGSTSSIFTCNEDGNYLLGYNTVWRTSAPAGRLAMATKHRVDVNGTDSPYFYSVSFVYSQGGANRSYPTATGILPLVDGDEVKIEYNRQDSNTIANAERVAASSGVWFLKLKDDWPVLRLRRSSNSAEIRASSSTFLEWNAQDEVGSHFSHSTSTDPDEITLEAENRHYLICVNVVCARSQSNGTHVVPQISMQADDGRGTGAFTVAAVPPLASYMHNGSNCNETSLNWCFIWAPPVPDQKIRFSVSNSSNGTGTNDWVALANQTSVSIVSLPEPGDPEAADTQYVLAREANTLQAADADAYLNMDTTDEESDFLSHDPTFADDTQIRLATAGWYLFCGGGYSVRSGGSTTPLAHRFVFHGATVAASYGHFGRQDLGDGISNGNQVNSGSSGSILFETPTTSIDIQLRHFEDSSGTDTNCDFSAGFGASVAVQGVRLAGLFPGHARRR